MGIIKDIEDLVQHTELLGRHVKLTLRDMQDINGTLHTMSEFGIIIKTTDGMYELYPWRYVMCIQHNPNNKEEPKESRKEPTVDQKPEWMNIDKARIERLVMADGIGNIIDNTDYVIYVDDNLNINVSCDETDIFDIEDNLLTVYEAEGIDTAKTIADKFKLEIERDYEE